MMIAILLAIIVFSLHDGEYFSHYFNEKGIPVDEKFVDILDTYKAGKLLFKFQYELFQN